MLRLIAVLIAFAPLLEAKVNPKKLSQGIEKTIRSVDPDVHVGIEIISVKDGQRLYQRNGAQLFTPASCLKIVTAAAALHILGVDYRFDTQVYTQGKIDKGVLKGNIYLKGSGDPALSTDQLEDLVFQLNLLGIEEIQGKLFIDNTAFDAVSQGPGWMWDEGANYWNSPMDALTVNHSCIEVWVRPNKKSRPPLLVTVPFNDDLSFENLALTTEERGELSVERDWKVRKNVVQIKGSMALNAPPKRFRVPVENPSVYTASLFHYLLNQNGIRFEGEIVERAVPKESTLLASVSSPPLSLIVETMMKESDNLIADSLFKKIGQARFLAPGTWKKGSRAIRDFLEREVGIDVAKIAILDGSGISRYNLIAPNDLVKVLAWMHEQFSSSAEFIASFPISGLDGSLKNRMTSIKGKVRAKTGGMTGVSSLSGYLTTQDEDVLAFSILLNGFTDSSKVYKERLEDEICTYLTGYTD